MSRKKRIDIAASRYAVIPLALLMMHGNSVAAEAAITPGSVLDTLGTSQPRMPRTPPQVVLPVQVAPSQQDPKAKRFRINAFDFSGNTVFKTRLLKRLVERYVDMELNLYDLNRAAETITTFYHDRGYTLARAVIPTQKVVDGRVTIQVVEGRIGKVRLTGNKRFSSGYIEARTSLLTTGSLVTTDRLETTMLLLNDIPGLGAKVVLEPGEAFGDTDAEIQLTEKLFSGSVGISNYGRKETGQNRLDVSFSVNSPFGWGDQLTVSGSNTNQSLTRYWRFGYSVPLNTAGTRLSVGASRVAYDIDSSLARTLGISGAIDTTEMAITHPVVRTRGDNELLSISLRHDRLTQTLFDDTASDNGISVMRAGYQFNLINEDSSVTNANFSLTTNFKGVDKNLQPTDPRYTEQNAVLARWEMDVDHTTPLHEKWDLFLHANVVRSNQMLPDTEKFSLGGPSSVRGYRPSELRGDDGYLGTVELRRPFSLGSRFGMFRWTLDTGEVTSKAPGFRDSSERLHSVGFGASFYPAKGIVASIDAARPIGPKPETGDGKSNRIWISISANF